VPTGNSSILEDTVTVLSSTEDSLGSLLQSRVSFSITVRRPSDGIASDVTAALAIIRDVVAGDEFANTVTTQEWLI